MLLKTVSPKSIETITILVWFVAIALWSLLVSFQGLSSSVSFHQVASRSWIDTTQAWLLSWRGGGGDGGLRLSLVWIVKHAVSRIEEEAMSLSIFDLCIGQIEASTCPGQPPPPGIWLFFKVIVQIPPYPGQNAVQIPHTRVQSGDQMPPPRGHFTGT